MKGGVRFFGVRGAKSGADRARGTGDAGMGVGGLRLKTELGGMKMGHEGKRACETNKICMKNEPQ